MAAFAPVYRPGDGQRSHLHRQQQRERKRRRLHAEDGPAAEDTRDDPRLESHEAPSLSTSASHPVHRKDPYHIAGHAREQDLPAYPFPHAPSRSIQPSQLPLDEQLASLQPPLILPGAPPTSQTTSLKRLHAGNLTTIMHSCMLRGDWDRASRAWGLLLRTEIAGEGPAIRKEGHWAMGAELLMRRQHSEDASVQEPDAEHEPGAAISEKGFGLAREYYERLILQFPHTPRSQHSVNALSIYPAMFNVWVFAVQDGSRRARQQLDSERPSTPGSGASATSNERLAEIRRTERLGATEIVGRLDELMTGPPYDTSQPLLMLRGMTGLWFADLNEQLLNLSGSDDSLDIKHQNDVVQEARTKARDVLVRFRSNGHNLPASLNAFVDDETLVGDLA